MNLNDYMNTHRIKPNADIANRWETRIVPMNESGADCAAAYLDKYGKGIGPAKLHGLASMAELKGEQEMAIAFWQHAHLVEFGVNAMGDAPAHQAQVSVQPPVAPEPVSHTWDVFPEDMRPTHLITMQPTNASQPREFYINHFGYGCQGKRDGNRLVVFARDSANATAYQSRSLKLRPAPSRAINNALLQEANARGPFILDCEIWYADDQDGEHRTAEQAAGTNRALGKNVSPQTRLTIFSALYADGDSLLHDTAIARIKKGAQIAISLSEHTLKIESTYTAYSTEGKAALCKKQADEGREGEVFYDLTSRWLPGKSNSDVLVRCKYGVVLPVVVTDLTYSDKVGREFAAIECAIWKDGRLAPIGNVGTGFTFAEADLLRKKYEEAKANGEWVVIEIRTQRWTEYGRVWHGSFMGFSKANPNECVGIGRVY